MNKTKAINKLIAQKIVEIIFLTTFIIISVPLWNSMDKKELFATSYATNDLTFTNLNIQNPIDYAMYPMSKTTALNTLIPTTIKVVNDSLTTEQYSLIFNYSKHSTLDYNFLIISIDDKVIPLNQLQTKETEENIYFILDESSLSGGEKEYKVRLWLDEKTGNAMQNQNLMFSFEIFKSATQM